MLGGGGTETKTNGGRESVDLATKKKKKRRRPECKQRYETGVGPLIFHKHFDMKKAQR